MMELTHKMVLLEETLNLLDLKPGLKVFEGTGGEGGLSVELARRISPDGLLIVTELDSASVGIIEERLSGIDTDTKVIRGNFRNIAGITAELGISALDRIVLDLGLSSREIENSGRGFSFERDEPLIMTFKSDIEKGDITAALVVNTWSEESLADIIAGFGGDKLARRIARSIVASRPLETTGELVRAIERVARRRGKLHPATKTFQAIRMAVNDELGALHEALASGWQLLSPRGRVAVISFHEAEDREVKKFIKTHAADGLKVTKKAVQANRREVKENPRSRSARLRVIEKI